MAHFAQINENNQVTRIIVVANSVCADALGQESEALGQAFCQQLYGANTHWVQTSYNASIRKNYAGVGYTYDAQRDAFIAPKPYASWTLDEVTCHWNPPVAYPHNATTPHYWDEATQSWIASA